MYEVNAVYGPVSRYKHFDAFLGRHEKIRGKEKGLMGGKLWKLRLGKEICSCQLEAVGQAVTTGFYGYV
jgi:hypothetical protein